jgi:hypothetical protein
MAGCWSEPGHKNTYRLLNMAYGDRRIFRFNKPFRRWPFGG